MRHLLMLCVFVLSTTGCLYKKVYDHTTGRVVHAAGKVYGKVLPSLPSGSGVASEPMQRTLFTDNLAEPPHMLVNVRVDNEDEDQGEAPRPARQTTNVSYQHTVQRAPSYPSSPYIAIHPVAKGSGQRVCKRFQQSDDNKAQCMAECRAQITTGPGSCTCMEMESCPSGVRVVD